MSGPVPPARARGPDWILIGALAGVVLFTGGAAYGVVSMIWTHPDKATPKKVVSLTPLVLIEGPTFNPPPSPERPVLTPTPLEPPATTKAPESLQRNKPAVQPRAEPSARPRPAPEQNDVAAANAPAKAPAQETVVVWRVVATANASSMNLGGHINKAGIVDSMASSHLRDALKAHRNFGRLPSNLRTHIEGSNIDLRRLAPYRALVGIDDARLEADHGVRFERVVASR